MPQRSQRDTEALSHADERRLVERAVRGEKDALRSLIDAHKNRLMSFVLRVVRDHHDAEEACQEAFLKAFRSLASFDSKYRFSTWLFTIAYRVCLNGMRRKHSLSGDVDFAAIASPAMDIDVEVAQSEEARHLKEIVWGAVEQLTTAQRATVVLFYREQQSCQEIAEVLGLPVATVKSHLHRARSKLREIFESQAAQDSDRSRILMGLAG